MDEKAANHGELRMALVFRGDLDAMTRGKSEGQAAHAAVELTVLQMTNNPEVIRAYHADNQPKIVLETPDLDGLEKIIAKASGRNVPFVAITDAGRTCFAEPTMTCVLIGPMSKTDSNAITRGTKMRDREKAEDAVGDEQVKTDDAMNTGAAWVDDIDEGNRDCLAKRRPGEPMFILLGRDPDAHTLARWWAERRLAAGGDPAHSAAVLAIAEAMRAYAADPANRPASAPAAEAYVTKNAPDPREIAKVLASARETLAGHPHGADMPDLALAWMANRAELHAQAVVGLVAALEGAERREVELPKWTVGRMPTISKHRAMNWEHLKETVDRLDAAGDRTAADTIVWQAWWRKLDEARHEFLAEDAEVQCTEKTMALLEALKPFAKAGELFIGKPTIEGYDEGVYMSAAGRDYEIGGNHLRAAHAAYHEHAPKETGT